MIQTLEAIVNEAGQISLLTEVRLKTSRRALVTILDEAPKLPAVSQKERLRAVFTKMEKVEMFRGIEDVKAWQKELRDEWE